MRKPAFARRASRRRSASSINNPAKLSRQSNYLREFIPIRAAPPRYVEVHDEIRIPKPE
jgi:hypothetical protein